MSIRTTLAALAVVALLLTGCGGDDSAPTANAEGAASADAETIVTDGVALFDTSTVHEIELTYDRADYDAMIETLAETGDKEWIEVTVTLDGVTYEHAGARLKGNSSLAGLSGGFGGGPGGGVPAGDLGSGPAGDQVREAPGGAGGFGGPGGSVSAEEPEGLPWLIRLDHFVEGQQQQGYADIVIRSNGSETSLNEAVALDLLQEAGLASQEAAHVRFAVNGEDSVLRLMIEHPSDDAWQDHTFSGTGTLYKAESTGDWSYRGDAQEAYNDVFDQEGGSSVTDLTPLIDFLEFINESDEVAFAAGLADRLDVDSFANYLAMMDLVQNFDDIDGPGNNAYLWWDAESEQFTVVPWDMNLAFGGLGGGEGGFPGGGLGANGEPPEGFEPPEGLDSGPAGFGRSNTLVERFHATAEFEALYQEKLAQLTAELYSSGTADEILKARVAVLTEQATDLVDAATIAEEADAIAQSIGRG